MKVRCFSVRLASLDRISLKAYKAVAFDGSSAIIPVSQVYGEDYDVLKSDAYWISAWILERVSIQYSRKKEAFFDKDSGRMLPNIMVSKHAPVPQEPVSNNEIAELLQ